MSDAGAQRALNRLCALMVRRSALIWAAALGLISLVVAVGYESAYPEGTDRAAVVELGQNPGFRALIGAGHALDTAGGFTAWRFGGPAVVIAAVWGYLTTTRLLRGEEEAGRTELVRAGAVTNLQITATATLTTLAASLALMLGALAGMVVAGLSSGGALLTAAAVVSGAWVFGALGVVASQILPTRRGAALACGGMVVAAFVVRALADTRAGAQWLRWGTPFGWSERVNAFSDPTVAALAAPVSASVLLVVAGLGLARRRDLGASLIADDVSREPRSWGLRAPLGLATRLGIPRIVSWVIPVVVLSFTLGSLAGDVAEFFESSETFQDMMRTFGVDPSLPVRGFLGFELTALSIVVASFAMSEMAATRDEESTARLDNLLVLAVPRRTWLLGRIFLAATGVVVLSVLLGVTTWLGTVVSGGGVSFGDLLGAGLNLIPVSLLFLGLGVLVFGAVPRATAGLGYGLVAVAFLWQLVGSAIDAPRWVLNLSPFAHVAPVPSVGVGRTAAVVLVVLGLAAFTAGLQLFARRDLHGA